MKGLIQVAQNAGWWIPFEQAVIISERTSKIIWRDEKAIHIEYPDGWTVSKLHPLEQLAQCAK